MIDERLALLAQATDSAIELLRRERSVANVVLTIPERLARLARFDWAAYWMVDSRSHQLQAIGIWSALGPKGQRLEQDASGRTLSMSQCNPGLVWRSQKPIWTSNVALSMSVSRSMTALEAGLRAGVWFAVKTDTLVYGVIELLARALPYKTPGTPAALERIGVRLGCVLEDVRGQQSSRLH